MGINLYSACDIYSYIWKDTSILSIVQTFINIKSAISLTCLIQILKCIDELIDKRDTLTHDTIQKIKETLETVSSVGI